jgi:peptide/nickel transport system permease protein
MGASGVAVVRRHLAPHMFPLLVTYSPLNAASAVVFEATLSYLGAGINPPTASLGNMISDGQSSISYAPHLLLVPAAAILLITLSFLLIGEGLKARNPDLARVSWLGR